MCETACDPFASAVFIYDFLALLYSALDRRHALFFKIARPLLGRAGVGKLLSWGVMKWLPLIVGAVVTVIAFTLNPDAMRAGLACLVER